MRQQISGGWDSRTHLVDDRWIEREPLRPEVEAGLRTETRLMRWLAPDLPLQVPVPVQVSDPPLLVRHRRVRGEPVRRHDPQMGRRLGQFLRSLHAKDPVAAVDLGAPDPGTTAHRLRRLLDRCQAEVVPRLAPAAREPGARLLDRVGTAPAHTLVHGDLGPAHLLVHAGRLHGVIDWTDAHVGDPALDLSWALNGATAGFAAGVRATYAPAGSLVQRARDWHLLGPWHEVLHGLDTDRPELVASGLQGVHDRLVEAPLP